MQQVMNRQEYKTYKHEKGKYLELDFAEQTPEKFVVGQKYKVGTGRAILKQSGEIFTASQLSYKKFLNLLTKKFSPDQILAFKWIPKRVTKPENLFMENLLLKGRICHGECVKTCVQPGCFCIEGLCKLSNPKFAYKET